LIVIISIIAAFYFVAIYKKDEIEIVTSFYVDKDSNLYYIENNNRLYKLDKTGRILFDKKFKENDEINEYEYANITADDENNIYMVVNHYKYIDSDNYILNQWIQVYDSEGNEKEKLFEKEIDSNDESESHIYTAHKAGDKYAIFSMAGKNTLEYKLYDFKTKKSVNKTYEFAETPHFTWIKATDTGNVYYTDDNYDLYCLDNVIKGEYNKIIDLSGVGNGLIHKLGNDENGNLYANDLTNIKLLKYNEANEKLDIVFNEYDNVAADVKYGDLYDMRIFGNKFVSLANMNKSNENFIFIKDIDSNDYIKIDHKYISFRKEICFFIISFLCGAAVLGLIYLYLYFFVHTKSILFRQISAISIFIIIASVSVSYIMEIYFSEKLIDNVRLQLYALGKEIKLDINKDIFKNIEVPLDINDSFYNDISKRIDINFDDFYAAVPDAIKFDFYYNIEVIKDNVRYVLLSCSKDDFNKIGGQNADYVESNIKYIENIYNDNEGFKFMSMHTEYGSNMLCMQKILDENGNAIGNITVSADLKQLYYEIENTVFKQTIIISAIMLAIMMIIIIMLVRTLRGLKILKEGAISVLEADWDMVIDINTNDEVEEIGNVFNKMTNKIKNYFYSIEILNKAYHKFVPAEIFDILEKNDILEVNPGDHIVKNMSIMTIETKNFSIIKSEMTAQENFDFINTFFGEVSKTVKKFGGVIESRHGTGITAIYENDTDCCIECGLAIFDKINSINSISAEFSIIMQNGEIMLGIVGNNERMEVTVISDILNSEYNIEKLAEQNRINMIITGEVYSKIRYKEKFNCRFIGRIQKNNLKDCYIELYDIIDSYSYDEKNNKLFTLKSFEKGVDFYINRDFKNARNQFIEVLKIDKNDKLAQAYIFLCDKYINKCHDSWFGLFDFL